MSCMHSGAWLGRGEMVNKWSLSVIFGDPVSAFDSSGAANKDVHCGFLYNFCNLSNLVLMYHNSTFQITRELSLIRRLLIISTRLHGLHDRQFREKCYRIWSQRVGRAKENCLFLQKMYLNAYKMVLRKIFL